MSKKRHPVCFRASQCEGFADTRLEWRPDRGESIPFEYTLRLERAVPIGGTVVDPDGQPVAGAKVGFGYSLEEAVIGGIPNPGYLFKFEADGYASYVTRVFSPDEGEVEFAVSLQPAETVTVTVLLPDGQPATRCDVGFISPWPSRTT